MSLSIDVDDVWAVLLADGWHQCAPRPMGHGETEPRSSFDLDAYEYLHEERLLLGGGTCAGVSATGATWAEPSGVRVWAPLSSVLAVASEIPES